MVKISINRWLLWVFYLRMEAIFLPGTLIDYPINWNKYGPIKRIHWKLTHKRYRS